MIGELRSAYDTELVTASAAAADGDTERAFQSLGRAHIISQRHTWQHVHVHWLMLKLGASIGDWREVFGQLSRIIAAAMFSRIWVPAGNTGRANVSAMKGMPIPDDLCILLESKSVTNPTEQLGAMPGSLPDAAHLHDLAERYTEAWGSQNAASVASFYSADGRLSVNAGRPAVGRGAITEAAQEFMTTFPDMKVIMDDLLVQGDRAVYRWTLVGTNTGPGGTGKRVRISGFEEWQIGADGLIAESRGHFDSAAYQDQIAHGVMNPK
jgi:predicted ester cyclase